MVDSKDEDYEAQCAAFLTMLDSNVPAEVFVAEVGTTHDELASKEHEQLSDEASHHKPMSLSQSWAELAVNSAEIEPLQLPEEGIYEPPRIWERPAGHAV